MSEKEETKIKLSFSDRIRKIARIMFFKRKIFYGRYADNYESLQKFASERDIILIYFNPGEDKLVELDYRLRKTEANKFRKWEVVYCDDNWITRDLLKFRPCAAHFKFTR